MQTLRYESALELGDTAPDVEVRCTDTTLGGQHLPLAQASSLLPSNTVPEEHTQRPVA